MAYTKSKLAVPARAVNLPWEKLAPGRYADEALVELDTGETVAVSVEREWLPNGEGVAFKAFARWVHEDGQTRLSPHGGEVETCLTFTAPQGRLDALGFEAIARELSRLLLGEAPTLHPEDEGTNLLMLAPEAIAGASIRAAIAHVAETRAEAIDPDAALGL